MVEEYVVEDSVMTAQEAAKKLGISYNEMRVLLRLLLFQKNRISGRYRVSKAHLKRLKEIMDERFY